MFDIGWTELLIIAIVLIVVVGPKDLPPMLRAFGKMTQRARRVASDFRAQFDEALREAEMDDLRQTLDDAKRLNPVNSLREAMNPLRQMGNDIKADLQKATQATSGADNHSAADDGPHQAGAESPPSGLGSPDGAQAVAPVDASGKSGATPGTAAGARVPFAGAQPAPVAAAAPVAVSPAVPTKAVRKPKAAAVSVASEAPAKPRRTAAKAAIGETAVEQIASKPPRTPRKSLSQETTQGVPVPKPRARSTSAKNITSEIKKDEA